MLQKHLKTFQPSWVPNRWDIVAFLGVTLVFFQIALVAKQMRTPYELGRVDPIVLDLAKLPFYALCTVFRMFVALFFSLVFALTFGGWSAKNVWVGRILLPLFDILQSVPVLGFLSISFVFFLSIFPQSMMGPECAAIFAIFTAQVWNMIFSFYQSLKAVPLEYYELSRMMQFSPWQIFWRVEVPYATPALLWNMMVSMSAGWFFVVASEAITVSGQSIMLPGMGSYIMTAILSSDWHAVLWAVAAMLVVIVLYDQLFFRPLVFWSEKFKPDSHLLASSRKPWLSVFWSRTRVFQLWMEVCLTLWNAFVNAKIFSKRKLVSARTPLGSSRYFLNIGRILAAIFTGAMFWALYHYVGFWDFLDMLRLGAWTALRVMLLLLLCSMVWVPVGVFIGQRPKLVYVAQPLIQIVAAFPANLYFPIVVAAIVYYQLNVEIWTAPLMILGAQWYILFNVIAAVSSLPSELQYAMKNFGVRGWLWWKRFLLPAIFPYYITGAITAAGGAWNASIVAERVQWGSVTLTATGLGAHITWATESGRFYDLAVAIMVMCGLVLLSHRLIWHPLYALALKRFQWDNP